MSDIGSKVICPSPVIQVRKHAVTCGERLVGFPGPVVDWLPVYDQNVVEIH